MTDVPEPLNCEGPMAADVVQMVSDFLKNPIESDGGYVDIPDEEWKMLHEIVYSIIEAKFQRDCDHDQTVEYELCNRKHGRMETIRMPYKLDTPAGMEQATHAIGMAGSIIDRLSRSMGFQLSEQRRANARKQKMQPVINFLARNGYIPAHDRVRDFVEGSVLHIGKDDTVWSPLGLSCADLRDLIHNRSGKMTTREHIEDIEDYLLNATNYMEGN